MCSPLLDGLMTSRSLCAPSTLSVFFRCSVPLRDLRSFPTRRSSDLIVKDMVICGSSGGEFGVRGHLDAFDAETGERRDRKSTRLNSSHVAISYAVFCLKKKKQTYSNIACDDGKGHSGCYMF